MNDIISGMLQQFSSSHIKKLKTVICPQFAITMDHLKKDIDGFQDPVKVLQPKCKLCLPESASQASSHGDQ